MSFTYYCRDGDDIEVKPIEVQPSNFGLFFKGVENAYECVRDVLLGNIVGSIDDIVREDPGVKDEKEILCILDIFHHPSGETHESTVIRKIFVSKPEWAASEEAEVYQIDLKKLSEFLEGVRSPYDRDTLGKIIEGIKDSTYNGSAYLSLMQVREILLFGTLFAIVPKAPEERDLTLLQKYLALDSTQPLQEVLMGDQAFDVKQSPTELPCFLGAKGRKMFPLRLARIRNVLDEAVLITLKNCPLRRTLPPKSQLLALVTKQGEVVTFLPGICMAMGQAVYQDGRNIVAECSGSKETLPLQSGEPVFFSESEQFGLLVADKDGQFQDRNFHGTKPEKQVYWLKGDLENYGVLFSDGSYGSFRTYATWNSLLFFDLGGNNGIAVMADRTAIDSSGKKLGEHIAAVSCCDMQYIMLRMDGSVVTDLGEFPIPGPARAVCADAQGYWISMDDKLLYYNGRERRQIPLPDGKTVEELARDNAGTSVGGRTNENNILFLR